MKFFKNQKGDTIVEVLISIAILSMVLVASYALSNRNGAYIQQSQERGEAQKISERQLELLRDYLSEDNTWKSSFRCFSEGEPPVPTDRDCNKGPDGRYGVLIRVNPDPDPQNRVIYTVTTIWDPLTGNDVQRLDLAYKLPVISEPPDIPPIAGPAPVPAPPAPPPPPPPTQFVFNGSNFASCISDGTCYTAGTSVFSCWNYQATYNAATKSVAPGNYKLDINYSNGGSPCSGAAAPSFYRYKISVIVEGGSRVETELSPPSGTKSVNIGALNTNSTIQIRWSNDFCCSGGDANLQINRLTLNKL